MAMSVVYTTIDGVLVHEDRGGVERQYVGDPLGSLVGELDENQNLTYTAEYWPYGEVRTESGNKQSEWGYVGLLGYLKDLAALLYVRARHYVPQKARWLTVDPLWPDEMAYLYGANSPAWIVDPSGLLPWTCIACGICLGVGVVAALLACYGAPEGLLNCITLWIENNPWVLAIIAACLVTCAFCLGHYITRLLRNLIRSKPKPPRTQPSRKGCMNRCPSTGFRLDRVPPGRPHPPCKGDHVHWYVYNQAPPPSCICYGKWIFGGCWPQGGSPPNCPPGPPKVGR